MGKAQEIFVNGCVKKVENTERGRSLGEDEIGTQIHDEFGFTIYGVCRSSGTFTLAAGRRGQSELAGLSKY